MHLTVSLIERRIIEPNLEFRGALDDYLAISSVRSTRGSCQHAQPPAGGRIENSDSVELAIRDARIGSDDERSAKMRHVGNHGHHMKRSLAA